MTHSGELCPSARTRPEKIGYLPKLVNIQCPNREYLSGPKSGCSASDAHGCKTPDNPPQMYDLPTTVGRRVAPSSDFFR